MPVRRHEPIFVPSRASSYATRHDYGIEDTINRADYLSSAVLQDTYDAASRSRGKDHELLRNVNAAIHSPSRSRESAGKRVGKRYVSPVPLDIKQSSVSTSKSVMPYSNVDRIRSALSSSAPSPTSLLSSRINSYLRGSSLPAHTDSTLSFARLGTPVRNSYNQTISDISYRPYVTHPPTSTFTPSILLSSYTSPRLKLATYDNDYVPSDINDDDDDYEPETSYRRKYKVVRSPAGSPYGSGVRRIGEAQLAYPRMSSAQTDDNDMDAEYEDTSAGYDIYSCPRPSGTSSKKLSSYDGDYDGSYEADMAEMYDYVPFGPSRQGILELTQHDNTSSPYLSSSTSVRSLSPPPPAPRSASSLSIVPLHSSYLDDALSKPYQSNSLLDSLVSNTVSRAKKVLKDSKLPDYKQASLVLTLEGSALSEDGKSRYGFKYYPPPIPLKGSHIGLDERILGISPKSVSPADSFLSNYLNKLRDIRTDVRDHVDRGEYGRIRSVVAATSRPAYIHSTVHMPVHIEGQAHSVPVSSYRSRLRDGQSHRVDVFPLVVSETSLPVDNKLQLPYYKSGGDRSAGSPSKLTVLEKINIKAAIIGSRMETESGRRLGRPRSEYAANKLRQQNREEIERRYK